MCLVKEMGLVCVVYECSTRNFQNFHRPQCSAGNNRVILKTVLQLNICDTYFDYDVV